MSEPQHISELLGPDCQDLADTYEIDTSRPLKIRAFIRAVRPYVFKCGKCGAIFQSVFVGRHSVRPVCDFCIAKADQESQRRLRPPYPMPPMYARDGSTLEPALAEWLAQPVPALILLSGGPGRGKTAQGHHLAAKANEQGKRWAILGDRDFIKPQDDQMHSAEKADLLVIDEIGRRTTEAATANVCEMIDRRVPWDRKTAIITNLTMTEIERIDPRLGSRLSLGALLVFGGSDLRLNQ
jgi:hypothetical protein